MTIQGVDGRIRRSHAPKAEAREEGIHTVQLKVERLDSTTTTADSQERKLTKGVYIELVNYDKPNLLLPISPLLSLPHPNLLPHLLDSLLYKNTLRSQTRTDLEPVLFLRRST